MSWDNKIWGAVRGIGMAVILEAIVYAFAEWVCWAWTGKLFTFEQVSDPLVRMGISVIIVLGLLGAAANT